MGFVNNYDKSLYPSIKDAITFILDGHLLDVKNAIYGGAASTKFYSSLLRMTFSILLLKLPLLLAPCVMKLFPLFGLSLAPLVMKYGIVVV